MFVSIRLPQSQPIGVTKKKGVPPEDDTPFLYRLDNRLPHDYLSYLNQLVTLIEDHRIDTCGCNWNI